MSATGGAAIIGRSRNRNRHLSENRFYSPPLLRKHREKQEQQRSSLSRTSSENRPRSSSDCSISSRATSDMSNLDRLLEHITPLVPARYFPKSCVMSSPSGGNDLQDLILKALRFGGLTLDDPAYVKPCITVLNKLNSKFYLELKNEVKKSCLDGSSNEKAVKKQKLVRHEEAEDPSTNICRRDNPVYILSSLLDVLLLKKDITNRHLLLGPLFKLLSKVFSEECMNESFIPVRRLSQPSNPSEGNNSTIYHIQQTLLIILEDIIISLKTIPLLNEKIKTEINIKLLIECARNSNVVITRNHVFSVISAITRAFPDEVLEYTLDILVVIGEAAVTQEDVLERAKRAKEKAAREAIEARGLISKSSVETTVTDSGNSKTSNSTIDPVTSVQFTDAPETDTKPPNEEKPSISSTSGE